MNTGAEAMPGHRQGGISRRLVVGTLGASWLGVTAFPGVAAAPRGLVVPRQPVPDWMVTDMDARAASLKHRLRGRVTAVQLMFAGCTTTCPIQGAIFAEVARRLPATDVRLLSLTVDPLGDGPLQLAAWLDRFGRQAAWSAAAPRPEDVDGIGAFLRGIAPTRGAHSTQVFLFDRDAKLAFRTLDMPSADHVVDLLGQLARA
jgi:protein SCO1/2